MKALVYKELRLSMHIMCYLFVTLFPLMILIPAYFYPWTIGFIYVFLTLVHHVALGTERRIKIHPTSSTLRMIGTVSPILANRWAAGQVLREQERRGPGLVLDGSHT